MARMALVEKEGATTPRMEIRMLRLDRRPVDVEIMGQPIVFAGHPADQTVIRDVTDRIQVEQERALNAKRAAEIERLRELDRLKTQFVNTLSHELRTPLTPIKVQLHILKNAPSEGEGRKRAMDMLERNLARIQSGGLRLNRARHNASPILHESLESFADVARANDVRLDVALEAGLWADLDPKRLSQVVFNLVGNAMKFTPRGGAIRVEAFRRSDAVTVRVTDSGVGLKAEDIAKLFEPFSQVHDTMQKTNSGTGLGLYICRGIVESHGGRIWCESDGPGKGATFAFSVPAADGPLAEPVAPKSA
jgi:signal transduction histidine kinase